jgi:release factor glutamine methyltransferase
MEETWTILKVLQWTTGYFGRHSIEQPRANAEVLLAHVLQKTRIDLYLHYDQPLTSSELLSYRQAIQRRIAREPTQYITRKQEFWSLEFEVNPSVLIPRPETELMVQLALDFLGGNGKRVLDLGTGSGIIAVAVAKECPSAQIFASDASLPALQVAKRNAGRHSVSNRVHFLAMDLFAGLSPTHTQFDLILSNPPYIGEDELSKLAPEVADYEPRVALRGGGAKGLEVIRKIIRDAPGHLKPSGVLILEIGYGQAEVLQAELVDNLDFDDFTITKDYSQIPRVLQLRKVKQVS